MEPLTAIAAAVVLVVALLVGLLVTRWLVRATVGLVKKLLALAFVLVVSAGLLVAAILAFAAAH